MLQRRICWSFRLIMSRMGIQPLHAVRGHGPRCAQATTFEDVSLFVYVGGNKAQIGALTGAIRSSGTALYPCRKLVTHFLLLCLATCRSRSTSSLGVGNLSRFNVTPDYSLGSCTSLLNIRLWV